MHIIQPIDAVARSFCAGILAEPLAHIVVVPVAVAAENHIWRRTYDGIEFLVLSHQFEVKLQQQLRFGRELFGTLQDTALQIAIQRFELSCFAVQLGEHPDLCTQQLLNDRNGDVIHRPMLVSFQPIQVGQVHG